MIYLPLQHLQPGMVLARSVYYHPTSLPLIVAGQQLIPEMIRKLTDLNISGVYIESKFTSDIEVKEFIEPKVKQQVTRDLKSLYSSYIRNVPLSSNTIDSMRNIAEELLNYITSKEEFLLNIIDIKDYDTYTYSHSIYVGTLSVLIGMQLNYSQNLLLHLAMAGLFHDIGKLDIPLEIINKEGPLTSEEFEEIKTHPKKAISRLEFSQKIPNIVLSAIESHHEKYNGTGYPHGLQGNNIPIYGRILALADVYDALTSARSYRRAWLPNEAVEYMMGCGGTHFDHDLLKAFLKIIAAYPVGTIVQLSNGSLAVVLQTSQENILRPKIRLLTPKSLENTDIDLATDRSFFNVTITGTVTDVDKLPNAIFE